MAVLSRLARRGSLFFLAIGVSIILASGNCAATEYSQDVSSGIPAFHYWAAPLSLNAGQYVHIQLQVNGAVDFYFMTASDYSKFTNLQSFQYYSGLSRLNANSIDANGLVPTAGTYYIVASNTGGLNSVSMTGHITASMNPVSSASNIPFGTQRRLGSSRR